MSQLARQVTAAPDLGSLEAITQAVEGGWGVGVAIFALAGVVAVVVGWLRQNGRPQP